MSKLLLIDGHSILNRAYYGVPPFTNSHGEPTGGVYGFINIMYKLLEQEKPTHIAVAFDRHEPTFRHKMYAEYKGTRKPMPDDLRAQVPVLKSFLRASGISVLELAGYEADDIIGTLSRHGAAADMDVSIVSGDRDLLQLVNSRVTQFIPKTKSGVTTTEVYTPAAMLETYGVTPLEFIDVKALQGDSSDNVPGVPGIGEKTAQALISEFHSLEQIKEHIDEVKPTRAQNALRMHFDDAIKSRALVTICLEVPLAQVEGFIGGNTFDESDGVSEEDFAGMKLGNIYTREAYEMLARLELKKVMKRFTDSGFMFSFDKGALKPQSVQPQSEKSAPAFTQKAYQPPKIKLPKPKLITYLGLDLSECDAVFEAAAKAEKIAIRLDERAGQKALLITYDGITAYEIKLAWMIDAAYIKAKLEAIIRGGKTKIVVLGLQSLLREFDLCEGDYFDAEIAAYLLNPLQSSYTAEDIARDYLGIPVLSIEPDELTAYSVTAIFAADETLTNCLKTECMWELFNDVEMPTAFALHEMELEGVRVNAAELKVYGEKLSAEIDKLEADIYELSGCEFNINSPKQLGEVLFEKMGLPGGKKTKTGYSTAADVLEKLKGDNPVIEKILTYRTYTKLKSTYAEGLAVFIQEDGRIHGHFQQTVTATGRISSTDPNLQNIPVREELGREIRKVFIPKEGCVFVDADYSQIELRVLAHFSGDERLIAAYKSAQDIHAITASEVFDVPLSEVTSSQRRAAKAVNFGIVYGESAFGLSEGLGISRKQANAYIDKYFATYPGVKGFLDMQVVNAKNQGFVKTLYNRKRPVPELKSSNYMQRQFGERVAMNSPIQGTAADIMKLAMLAVTRALKKEGLRSRVVLQVHDELLLEVPIEEKEQVMELLRREMSGAASLLVPLEISIEAGNSWFETK